MPFALQRLAGASIPWMLLSYQDSDVLVTMGQQGKTSSISGLFHSGLVHMQDLLIFAR